MVGNPTPRGSCGPHLDRADPARLVDWNRRQGPEPHVLAPRGHGVRFGFDHQIRFAAQLFGEPPAIILRPLFGRWYILGVTHGRAPIYPTNDGRDLIVRERK